MNSIAFVWNALAASNALAVAATTVAPKPDPAPAWYTLLSSGPVMIGAVFLVTMLLFGNKGKRADEKQRLEMLKNLKRGDRIQTIGGVLGAVVRAEPDRVEVKVDESSNVKIWFARNAISKVVVDGDKAEAK